MKKIVALALAASLLFGTIAEAQTPTGRGGLMGFIAGCCFGIRAAGAYNEGKEIHWREWVRLIPYLNIVFAIWDGIDGANGMTTGDYAKKYGSVFY